MAAEATPSADSGKNGLGIHGHKDTPAAENAMGYLDVFVHRARDIHNICIYHKQDVYAKLRLTSGPESAGSTKTINGGGQNPIFNDNVHLAVYTAEASVRCEVWMLSRVQNYLEDQLLGFAVVPLADVLMSEDRKIEEEEFPLSSTELFHSPAGFVQLSMSYVGYSPEVIAISPSPKPPLGIAEIDEAGDGEVVHSEFEKIEFPDLNIAKENEIMVSEYFNKMPPCSEFDDLSSDSLTADANGKHSDDDDVPKKNEEFRNGSPLSCVSTADSSAVHPGTPQSVSEPSPETVSSSPDQDGKNHESPDGGAAAPVEPVISISIGQEDSVVQQDIVDMYMKSLQQFTDSLAKMKLPMDAAGCSNADSGNTSTSSTEQSGTPTGSNGPKVFYGSRAFF